MVQKIEDSQDEWAKSSEIWLSKPIFYFKSHQNPSNFFSLKNMTLGAHVFLLTLIFWITLFSKMMPNFWQIATTPILKIHWFLAKNLSNFVSLAWKLYNRYCHTVDTFLLQNESLPMVMQGELEQTYSPMLRHFMGSSLAGLYPSLQIHLPTLIVVLRKQSLLAPRQSSSFKQST